MKKYSLIIFLLMFNFAFANVWDNQTKLQNIVSQLPDIDNIKCKFKQEKIIPNIERKLISNGDFEFIKNEGVYFYTKYPIQKTFDYTNKNYKQINDVINAIASKKYKRLEKDFDVYFEKKSEDWQIGLKPKQNSNASEFLYSITIYGKDYINKIEIKMVNEALTTIWFEK